MNNTRWTAKRTAITSFVLAIVSSVLLYFLRSSGVVSLSITPNGLLEEFENLITVLVISLPITPNWPLGEFADLITILVFIISIIAPSFWQLGLKVLHWIQPKPGNQPYEDNKLSGFRSAFDLDRGALSFVMVPAHSAKAKPSSSSRSIHLGDAAYVIPKTEHSGLQEFIGNPRNRNLGRSSLPKDLENEILVVTGEPGAGKSVFMQELHATLSLGVENGFHSFVPLIVFARDILLTTLRRASEDSEAPMCSFLKACYEQRFTASPAEQDLKFLYNLIANHWDETDFLIIVDGLDEIPQRSAYEEIQQELVKIIISDLKSDRSRVHRYILSCRVDEDLELFHDANTLFIRGLTNDQRDRFCYALIQSSELDKQMKGTLEEALKSPRLIPAHVFHRNPYFLALLLMHVREDQERVREKTLDFDYLMRKYLEREAQRPYASVSERWGFSEDRRTLFAELEKISRACLQSLAFLFSSSWS